MINLINVLMYNNYDVPPMPCLSQKCPSTKPNIQQLFLSLSLC